MFNDKDPFRCVISTSRHTRSVASMQRLIFLGEYFKQHLLKNGRKLLGVTKIKRDVQMTNLKSINTADINVYSKVFHSRTNAVNG